MTVTHLAMVARTWRHWLLVLATLAAAEVWEKDMSEEIYIEAAHEGYEAVNLRCKENVMEVNIVTEEDFDGVIYTRGSYMDR